ncbi:hypothetical protein DMX02_22160 [Pseudomonas jessenii]|nr:hypothetical protein DMX02_22160 [Pseudomonas jessenii]
MCLGSEIHTYPCGSEPARESGVSFNEVLSDRTPSRAGSLPQWDCGYFRCSFSSCEACSIAERTAGT